MSPHSQPMPSKMEMTPKVQDVMALPASVGFHSLAAHPHPHAPQALGGINIFF